MDVRMDMPESMEAKKGVRDSFVSSISHALKCLQISGRKRSTTLGEKSTALAFH